MATSTPFVTDPLSVWRSTLNHALRDGKDDTTKVGALRSLTAMSLIGDQRISWPIKYVINNEMRYPKSRTRAMASIVIWR